MINGESLILEMRKISQDITENRKMENNAIKLKELVYKVQNVENTDHVTKMAETLLKSIKHLLTLDKSRHAAEIAEAMFETNSFSKNIKFIPLEFFKIQGAAIVGDDLLNDVISIFEDKNDYKSAASVLSEAGLLIHKLKRHEHAVAVLGRAVSYYLELENEGNKHIESIIIKMLDIARELASNNDENSQFYIKKVNDITKTTGIQVEGYGAQAAHSSYTEQLINLSTIRVRSNIKKFGRKHKKKRQFFGKKK